MSESPRPVSVLRSPIDTSLRPPGSKSETIRALATAALAPGRSHLYGPLASDDTMAMAGALEAMGIEIGMGGDPWSVDGEGGRLEADTTLDAIESGLSARILIAMAASAPGVTRIEGRGRLTERPMGGIIDALREQGVEIDGDHIPLEVSGRGKLWGGYLSVDCSESSQFATALMIVAPVMEKPCVLDLKGLIGSAGYLDGTVSVMRRFGARVESTVTGYEIANHGYVPSDLVVEPDASAAVYPMAIAAITGGRVVIDGLGSGSWQPDLAVARALEEMGCSVQMDETRTVIDASGVELIGLDLDMSDAPDGALAVAVVALFARSPTRIRGLTTLRHKESDRLDAISTEMGRLGGDVEVLEDGLLVRPSSLRGAVVEPHGDHRIAMSMACIGTRIEGVSVASPQVVTKTWPGFWSFLDLLTA